MKQTMVPIFFTNKKLLIAGDLPKRQKYNQDHIITDILPELERAKKRYKRRKPGVIFSVPMDHSESMTVGKSRKKLRRKAS
jgi:hypothetical protein